jgi:hypothetical protein
MLVYAKRTVACVVTILLLAVSSSVSLCEISCSLSKPHPSLHLAKVASLAQSQGRRAHAFHSHCGHTALAKLGSTTSHSFESVSRCSNAPCAQAAVLPSLMKGQDGARIESRPLALLSVLPYPGQINPSPRNIRCEAGRRWLPLVDGHSVDLRI